MTEETSGQTVLVSMSYNDDLGGGGVSDCLALLRK